MLKKKDIHPECRRVASRRVAARQAPEIKEKNKIKTFIPTGSVMEGIFCIRPASFF